MKKLICILTLLLAAGAANALDLSPLAQTHFDNGVKYYKSGNLLEAKNSFQNVIRLEPNCVDAYHNLGAIFEKQDNMEAAIITYKEAYEANSSDYETICRLGYILKTRGQTAEAVKYLTKVPRSAGEYYLDARELLNQINPVKYPFSRPIHKELYFQNNNVQKTVVAPVVKTDVQAEKIKQLQKQIAQNERDLEKQQATIQRQNATIKRLQKDLKSARNK